MSDIVYQTALHSLAWSVDVYILTSRSGVYRRQSAQVILHEKSDFETRLVRSARRKKWLMANQTLLRTLLRFTDRMN